MVLGGPDQIADCAGGHQNFDGGIAVRVIHSGRRCWVTIANESQG